MPSLDPKSLTWIRNKLEIASTRRYDAYLDGRMPYSAVRPPRETLRSPCQICDRRFHPELISPRRSGAPIGKTVACASCQDRALNEGGRDALPLARIEATPWRRLAARAAHRWRRIASFFWTFPIRPIAERSATPAPNADGFDTEP